MLAGMWHCQGVTVWQLPAPWCLHQRWSPLGPTGCSSPARNTTGSSLALDKIWRKPPEASYFFSYSLSCVNILRNAASWMRLSWKQRAPDPPRAQKRAPRASSVCSAAGGIASGENTPGRGHSPFPGVATKCCDRPLPRSPTQEGCRAPSCPLVPPSCTPWLQAEPSPYLDPHGLHGGPRRREVLPVPCPCIGEGGACHPVIPVPLDGPAAVQEIFLGVLAPKRQEIAGFCDFFDADLSGSSGDNPNINVTWGAINICPGGNQEHDLLPGVGG